MSFPDYQVGSCRDSVRYLRGGVFVYNFYWTYYIYYITFYYSKSLILWQEVQYDGGDNKFDKAQKTLVSLFWKAEHCWFNTKILVGWQ